MTGFPTLNIFNSFGWNLIQLPPIESPMVRYFQKDLKPSIKAEMNQEATYLDNYKELVAKAVTAKAKASL